MAVTLSRHKAQVTKPKSQNVVPCALSLEPCALIRHVPVAGAHFRAGLLQHDANRSPFRMIRVNRVGRGIAQEVLIAELLRDLGERLVEIPHVSQEERAAAGDNGELGKEWRPLAAEGDQ